MLTPLRGKGLTVLSLVELSALPKRELYQLKQIHPFSTANYTTKDRSIRLLAIVRYCGGSAPGTPDLSGNCIGCIGRPFGAWSNDRGIKGQSRRNGVKGGRSPFIWTLDGEGADKLNVVGRACLPLAPFRAGGICGQACYACTGAGVGTPALFRYQIDIFCMIY